MLSITFRPTPTEFPTLDRETGPEEREMTPVIEIHRANEAETSFDLFAEARQIYARAKMGGRVRASTII